MKRITWFLTLSLPMIANAQLKYPETHKKEVVTDYHGTTITDPYQWLEDDNSENTKEWVKEQNSVTFDYLATIPYRERIKKRLALLWNYPRYSSPYKKAEYYYYYKNDGLQNQSVLYRQKGLDGEPEVFLDPNTLNKDGIAALGSLSFSKNSKYVAYSVAIAGSDWQDIFVMETATKKLVSDKVEWTKFGGANWNGDEGFYYSGYDKPDEKTKLSKANEFHKVFYHKIGTPQSEDKLVFEDKKHPLRYHGAGLTVILPGVRVVGM
ncbi:MAG: S9 family peptidase, partial [Chitinophagaceae bacterium]|nr:S9 family peptidase [Chitinophagaceae bacterium]